MNNRILAIIPARGGSKGVKRKNIRTVAGEPLIYWSIKSANSSSLLSYTYVNTDDMEIAEVAKSRGADVLMRPANLAEDKTPMIPVLQYACREVERLHGKIDIVVLLQPTAPMRSSEDIDSAIRQFQNNPNVDSLVSVYQVDDCHPSRMYRLEKEGNGLEKIYSEPAGSLRQDLEPIYHRNGAIYICKRDLLMNEGLLTGIKPMPYIMSKSNSVNIDDEQDLMVADYLMSMREND